MTAKASPDASNRPQGRSHPLPSGAAELVRPLVAGSLDDLENTLLRHDVLLLVLFGSTASGARHARSDLDLAVLFGQASAHGSWMRAEMKLEQEIEDVLRPGCPVNVTALNRAGPLLEREVADKGVPLYAQAPDTWPLYRMAAYRRFEDTAKYRRRRLESLLSQYGRHDDLRTMRRAAGAVHDQSGGRVSALLAAKCGQLADYVKQLERMLAADVPSDLQDVGERALERMVQLLVECAADAGDLWLEDRGRPQGHSASGVFQNLSAAGVLGEDIYGRLRGYVKTRNRIVHDYDTLVRADVRRDAEGLARDIPELLGLLLAP